MPDGDAYELRWFTSKNEVDLCGHARGDRVGIAGRAMLNLEGKIKI